jgi:hypothetical protein
MREYLTSFHERNLSLRSDSSIDFNQNKNSAALSKVRARIIPGIDLHDTFTVARLLPAIRFTQGIAQVTYTKIFMSSVAVAALMAPVLYSAAIAQSASPGAVIELEPIVIEGTGAMTTVELLQEKTQNLPLAANVVGSASGGVP